MNARLLPLAALLVALSAVPAFAHFVWITVAKDSAGQEQVQVHFSELAEPDVATLLDRITNVKVWGRTTDGKSIPVEKLTKQLNDEVGSLVAALPADAKGLSGTIKYGVLERRGEVFLLQYHAKFLDSTADLKSLGRDEKLPLDVVPHAATGGLDLEVLFEGKPVEGSEVVLLDPDGNESTAKTNAAGRITIKADKPGVHSIRAKWVVKQAGKEGDKEYPQVNHYSTLALRVPQPVK
jgi:uncharacterized GH25 family protein